MIGLLSSYAAILNPACFRGFVVVVSGGGGGGGGGGGVFVFLFFRFPVRFPLVDTSCVHFLVPAGWLDDCLLTPSS